MNVWRESNSNICATSELGAQTYMCAALTLNLHNIYSHTHTYVQLKSQTSCCCRYTTPERTAPCTNVQRE